MIRSTIQHTTFTFPVGEMQVKVTPPDPKTISERCDVTFTFSGNESVIELLLFCDAAVRTGYVLHTLHMPYVPFSRQDRVNAEGEAFSLAVFANLINSLQFQNVIITDPHSDVTTALIRNVTVIPQYWGFIQTMSATLMRPYYIVSPDAGAQKKIYTLSKEIQRRSPSSLLCRNFKGVIEAGKQRNTSTGDISGTIVYTESCSPDCDYVIVDDICDGGRTFIELAKALRAKGATQVTLYVTHGFFTKGLHVFAGVIDMIYTPTSGRVFPTQGGQ